MHKLIIFLFIVISLPAILNIIDNLIKIVALISYNEIVSNKILEFSKIEFIDFILEFLIRAYKYDYYIDNDDIYLCIDDNEFLLYYNNKSCGEFTLDDALEVIALCESKGIDSVFIFTSKVINDQVKEFLDNFSLYDIKYIHGLDLNLNYQELVLKYY